MKILIIGGGPAGLYAGLLLKKINPAHQIRLFERNPTGVTYGWGVVFSDRTLSSLREADPPTHQQITENFVNWTAIDTYYQDELIRCDGHRFAGLARQTLLDILQTRCHELGVQMTFETEITVFSDFKKYDLVIAADGVNSRVRETFRDAYHPNVTYGGTKYIWLGTDKVLDAFTFIFQENEHGLFQAHAYPFDGGMSTFIVECEEAVWRQAGLEQADEAQSLNYCQDLFANFLEGHTLYSNKSRWINFVTVTNKTWRHENIVLLGDAAHTAHFSVGSGTKLAMDDAIALAEAFNTNSDSDTALDYYEMDRQSRVEILQEAARDSQAYFENIKRYLHLRPMQFVFHLLTRSGRITYDNLRTRDPCYLDAVDRWYSTTAGGKPAYVAPPPLFNKWKLRSLTFPNRLVGRPEPANTAVDGSPDETYTAQLVSLARTGAALLMTEPVAVSPEGRITPKDPGMYAEDHLEAWRLTIESIRAASDVIIALQLNHAGRRGATRPRDRGLDRPLKDGSWPLIAPSPLAYTPKSQSPRPMQADDFARVCKAFVQAAEMAAQAGFDMLQLHFGHGYLLGSFLSPLTNQREDNYGGSLEKRMRYPLEVFDAVRAAWPNEYPLSVAVNVTDWASGGSTIDDAVALVSALKARGSDLVEVLAGQTIADDQPVYLPGFLTPFSDQIRQEAGIPTMVGGYLTTTGQVNTILAGGRADLCVFQY